MSRFFIALVVFSLLFFVVEFYAFQALKTITKNKYVKIIWVLAALAIYINLFYTVYSTPRSAGQTISFQLAAGFLVTFLIPKLQSCWKVFSPTMGIFFTDKGARNGFSKPTSIFI